jgi:hypothetical protein
MLLAAAVLGGAPRALASQLSAAELQSLARGEVVQRPVALTDEAGERLVGGVAYSYIDASPTELAVLLDDMEAYRKILPLTQSADLVGRNDFDQFVQFRQGTKLFSATYTVRVRRELDLGRVRFWLEPSQPHTIPDIWGFFRWQPVPSMRPRILLTYGVLAQLGPAMLVQLFEARVQRVLLTVPGRLKDHLARRAPRPASLL